MAERINVDPHLEVMPDHAGPHYGIICATLTQNGLTEEQAVQALNNSWLQAHNEWIQRWEQQTINDANAAEEAQRVAAEEEQCGLVQVQQEIEAQQQVKRFEPDAKKQKMKDFNDNVIVGNYIALRPAQYAIRWIKDFEFVELWYFTTEGCADALQHQHTQNDDTFSLSKADSMLTLKSVLSLKASKNVIPDAKLTFWQMSMAKNALIPLLNKYNWTEKSIRAFAQFWTQLKVHSFRQCEYRERALLVYQAPVRREWHDQMKLGKGFNISAMNEDLLHSIYREILDKAQLNSINGQ